MTEPAIQYTQTNDGFKIAFTDGGAGLPFVLMPQPLNHVELLWRSRSHRPLFEALSQRYRLIQYDGRGVGMSDRGLPDDFTVLDYVVDLEAVLGALGLERALLFAPHAQSHTAIRYAVAHPERVRALILWQALPSNRGTEPSFLYSIARDNWERYLVMMSQTFLPGEDLDAGLALLRISQTQEDALRLIRATDSESIEELLPQLQVPTLLLYKTKAFGRTAEFAKTMATGIAGSRLVFLKDDSDLYGYPRDAGPLVAQVETFVSSLKIDSTSSRSKASAPESLQTLTPRELEVLGLIAGGSTNKEIASQLVLSERTVGRHITNIYAKIQVRSKSEATAFAIRHALT